MKYIKLFEDLNVDKPQIGDYVLIDTERISKKYFENLKNFLENNIGCIKRYEDPGYLTKQVVVVFEEIPQELQNQFKDDVWEPCEWKRFDFSEIKYWSEDKEDLKMILQAKKYNL